VSSVASINSIHGVFVGAATGGGRVTVTVTVTVLVHGGGVLPGMHKPPGGGAIAAVFAICACGLELTVAITV